MASVNKSIILGRLGQDPELTYTQSGIAVCKFSMATSRKQKNGQEVTQWHRCTAFDKAGELIAKYVSKGNMLYIEGEINYSKYQKDGVEKYSTYIIVREFNFIGGNGQQTPQNNPPNHGITQQNQGSGHGQQNGNYQGGNQQGNTGGPGQIPDDDIPFYQ